VVANAQIKEQQIVIQIDNILIKKVAPVNACQHIAAKDSN